MTLVLQSDFCIGALMVYNRESRKNVATLLLGSRPEFMTLNPPLISHVSLSKEFLPSGAQFPQL